jgi:membrane-bound lytic murein transglycosylase B
MALIVCLASSPDRLASGQASTPAPDLAATPVSGGVPSFEVFLREVGSEAVARGIREATVTTAFTNLQPLPVVIERDRTQAEQTLPFDRYLKQRLSSRTIQAGRRYAAQHAGLLRKISAAYGVPAEVIVATWGIESNFGRFTGVRSTIAALATLAYDARRSAYFREELIQALTILDRGDIELARMQGSWAGAMGQPQFMPSSYLKFAEDFDGDGRRDIWSSRADVFASIASYLKGNGWTEGERWGRRVQVPSRAAAAIEKIASRRSGACRALGDMSGPLPVSRWRRLGVRTAAGGALPASDMPASLIALRGASFLVYGNYEALLAYNCSHSYALSLALLAERIGPPANPRP